MSYLDILEYRTLIRDDVFNLIKNNDENVRTFAELAAQQEIESYLSSRYDTAIAFLNYNSYSETGNYTQPQRVVYNAKVYECLSATTVTGAFDVSKWNLLFEKSNLLTMYMIDIALYHVHSRIMPQQIPKLREDRYNAAITWLEKVSEGVLSANLPLLKNADGEQESGVAKHGDRGTVSVRGSRYF